ITLVCFSFSVLPSGRLLFQRAARARSRKPDQGSFLSPPATGEIVERPVELLVDHFERVFRDELFFGGQQAWLNERDDRTLDRAPVRKCRRRLVGIRGRELALTPGEDGVHAHLAALPIELHTLGPREALVCDLSELAFELGRRERLAAKPAAADGPAAEREIDPRIVERGQDRLFDLVKRQRAAADSVREPLEGPGDLPDAAGRILRKT